VETTLVSALRIACVGRRTKVIGDDFVQQLGDASIGAARRFFQVGFHGR
jgi:hypothetical protein